MPERPAEERPKAQENGSFLLKKGVTHGKEECAELKDRPDTPAHR